LERSGTERSGAERGSLVFVLTFNESEDDGENMLAVSATVGPFLHFKATLHSHASILTGPFCKSTPELLDT
jgi:hypothetical protein